MKLQYMKDIVSLSVDQEKCIGCAMCIEVCPHDVFELENNKIKILDKNACMECGACMRNCPVQAISVHTGTGGLVPVIEEMLKKNKQK